MEVHMFDNGTKYKFAGLILTIIGKRGDGEIIVQDQDGWQQSLPKAMFTKHLTLYVG
jgi:hypothetical protein